MTLLRWMSSVALGNSAYIASIERSTLAGIVA
jgi:hypothetical protein